MRTLAVIYKHDTSSMNIKEAKFLMSNTRVEDCPAPDKPEYAFIGRSNVGKSSLINMLTHQKGLAKTSAAPGKTQLINHFLINDSWYLVDLPGYGYAQVSKKSREDWRKMINYYFQKRENLTCVFALIDARHEPLKQDLDFINHLGNLRRAFCACIYKTGQAVGRQDRLNHSSLSA